MKPLQKPEEAEEVLQRQEQECAQGRAAPLAAALAEAQQVMCTASPDCIPYAHTHSHMHWPSKVSDI